MLSLLAFHLTVTVICFLWGFCFYECISKNHTMPLISYFITGLIFITAIGQIISLFIPLNASTNIIILLLPVIPVLLKLNYFKHKIQSFKQNFRPIPRLGFLLLGSIYFLIIILNAGPIMMDDTGSYHIQMIKWIEEYGTVPGIANLHERYGFNSSWFTSIAAFNFFPHKMQSFIALNGLLSIWFCYYFIDKAFKKELPSSIKTASLLTIVLALISWPLLRGNAATANYDSITMLVVAVLFTEMIEKDIQKNDITFRIEYVLWPAYLFTVRIINFPFLILIFIPVAEIIKHKNWRRIITVVILPLILIVPFLCRNVILSGYLFYPSSAFDLFTVDWKTPKEVPDRLVYFITYYSRVNNGFLDIEATAQLGNIKWIKSWFHYMFGYDKLIFLPGIAGIIIYLILIFRYVKKSSLKKLISGVAMLTAVTVWFFTAPDPRFIYGFLTTGCFLLFSFIFKKQLWKNFIPVLSVIIASTVIVFSIIKLQSSEYRNFVFTKPLPQPEVKKTVINGIEFNIPGKVEGNWNERCYGTDLPCLYLIYPGLEPRGENIKDGFRIKKQN